MASMNMPSLTNAGNTRIMTTDKANRKKGRFFFDMSG
jgi:hypothetical protein